MTNNTIFFMCNHEDNPLEVTDWELIVQHIGVNNGVESTMNIYLLHSITYPTPIIYITKEESDNFKFTYIDVEECKYVQPVLYDTGEIIEKISHLTEDELDVVEESMDIKSTYGTTYDEIFEKTRNFKVRSALACIYNNKLRKPRYNAKRTYTWLIPPIKDFLKEETK